MPGDPLHQRVLLWLQMREHQLSRQEILRRAVPETARPRISTAVPQQQQEHKQEDEVEEVTLISDDEEPQQV